MKKFQFSLDTLKGYKGQVLEREKNALAHLRRQQQQLEEEKNDTILKLQKSSEDFVKRTAEGINILQIQVMKGYQQSLKDQIDTLSEEINRMENRVQNQMRIVIDATKEVSSLEKLEDKQLEEYNFKVAKAEEQFISEYVLNSSYKNA